MTELARVSIVLPCLNEAAAIVSTLQPLQSLRELGCEIILCDGGSDDNTVALAAPWVDQLITSAPGRSLQMNAGAEKACGQWLLFLHADTQLPSDSEQWLQALSRATANWGFFRVALSGRHYLLRLIEKAMNVRSAITQVATGDQGIFCRRETFNCIGGFENIALMEDVVISKSLRRGGRAFIWPSPVISSSRRWESRGIIKTVLQMWWLRLRFVLGASPQQLHREYYD